MPHNYEYTVDIEGPTAPARVVRMVGKSKRVLEVGAGPGSITKLLKEFGNCRVTGLEIDREAIKKLTPFCERVYEANLNDPAWPDLLSEEPPFEVLVAADVLEHVYNPLEVLQALAALSGEKGQIVISLPHVGHNAIISCLLNEDFEYRDWGLLDRTHIRFFGLKNMQLLFDAAGLKIIDAQFVTTPPEETEFADKWNNLPSEMKEMLAKHPHGHIYQVVVKAVDKAQAGEAMDLISLPVKRPVDQNGNKGWGYFPRKIARRFLDEATRRRINIFLNRYK